MPGELIQTVGSCLPGIDAEAAHALLSESFHRGGEIGFGFIDDGHSAEDAGMLLDHVEHVAVVGVVVAHLNEHDAGNALGLAMDEELLGGEASGLHVCFGEAGGEWVALRVGCPNVAVGVDVALLRRGEAGAACERCQRSLGEEVTTVHAGHEIKSRRPRQEKATQAPHKSVIGSSTRAVVFTARSRTMRKPKLAWARPGRVPRWKSGLACRELPVAQEPPRRP